MKEENINLAWKMGSVSLALELERCTIIYSFVSPFSIRLFSGEPLFPQGVYASPHGELVATDIHPAALK